ncbi:transposase [Moorena sp. SIO3A5]
MRKGSHVVFSIHLHIVFVTKYRRQVFTKGMLDGSRSKKPNF